VGPFSRSIGRIWVKIVVLAGPGEQLCLIYWLR
jgi:hypothetical protein